MVKQLIGLAVVLQCVAFVLNPGVSWGGCCSGEFIFGGETGSFTTSETSKTYQSAVDLMTPILADMSDMMNCTVQPMLDSCSDGCCIGKCLSTSSNGPAMKTCTDGTLFSANQSGILSSKLRLTFVLVCACNENPVKRT